MLLWPPSRSLLLPRSRFSPRNLGWYGLTTGQRKCKCCEGCSDKNTCFSDTDCSECSGTTPKNVVVFFSSVAPCGGVGCFSGNGCTLTSFRNVATDLTVHPWVLPQSASPCVFTATFTSTPSDAHIFYQTFGLPSCVGAATDHTPDLIITATRTATGWTVTAMGSGGETLFSGSGTSACDSDPSSISNTVSCSCTGPVITSGGTVDLTLCPAMCTHCTDCCLPLDIAATVSGVTTCDLTCAGPADQCPIEQCQKIAGTDYNPNKTLVLRRVLDFGRCRWTATEGSVRSAGFGLTGDSCGTCSGSYVYTTQVVWFLERVSGKWKFDIFILSNAGCSGAYGQADYFSAENSRNCQSIDTISNLNSACGSENTDPAVASQFAIGSGGSASFDFCP